MKFFLDITVDNDAFGESHEERHAEVSNILLAAAKALEAGKWFSALKDSNGNKVGSFEFDKPNINQVDFILESREKLMNIVLD